MNINQKVYFYNEIKWKSKNFFLLYLLYKMMLGVKKSKSKGKVRKSQGKNQVRKSQGKNQVRKNQGKKSQGKKSQGRKNQGKSQGKKSQGKKSQGKSQGKSPIKVMTHKNDTVDLLQHSKKYMNRKSPPYPANKMCGQKRLGNDDNVYHSKPNKNGICTWRKIPNNGY